MRCLGQTAHSCFYLMKVEIISISDALLMSDILDTNTAYVSRILHEIKATLTSKVIIGNELAMILDCVRVALRRADIVITIGGIKPNYTGLTVQALASLAGVETEESLFELTNVRLIGQGDRLGLQMLNPQGIIFCLPAERRDLTYLLEGYVLPQISKNKEEGTATGWILLRTVGMMQSTLKQALSVISLTAQQKITFDSFAGQSNIRLWAEAENKTAVSQQLNSLKEQIKTILGDFIFGEGESLLEQVVLHSLGQRTLTIAECDTEQTLSKTLHRLPSANIKQLRTIATNTPKELANFLGMPTNDNNLNQWCRQATETLRQQQNTNLSLLVYKNESAGGTQLIITLASEHGVSVTNRSFGGHPEHINQWACTLALAHLRRWLLVHA